MEDKNKKIITAILYTLVIPLQVPVLYKDQFGYGTSSGPEAPITLDTVAILAGHPSNPQSVTNTRHSSDNFFFKYFIFILKFI